MVKLRNAYYCNLKLLLIFLVVYGHAIEPSISEDPSLYRIYRLIYLFHMPLFAFLSGLFVKSASGKSSGCCPSILCARASPSCWDLQNGTPPGGSCGTC